VIGDDVVDLDDPAIASHHLRARFLDRVLHPGERAALSAARSPKVLLWTFFAAKEAAYKIAVKRAPTPPVFAHRAFVVSDNLGSVRYGDEVYLLVVESDVEAGWVHAIARSTMGDTLRAVAARTSDDASFEARALLCRTIAPHLGCAPSALAIVRPPLPGSWDGFGPPHLTRDGSRLPIDVSLSHDGRFVSFASEVPR
jgi:hypothetical protein